MTRQPNVFTTRRGSRIVVSFLRQPKVEITGDADERFAVAFIDRSTGETFCDATIGGGMWAAAAPCYYVPWRVALENSDDASERFQYDLELEGQTVAVVNMSAQIGDAIGWMPAVEAFRRERGCRVIYKTAHRDLFEAGYPEIEFVDEVDERAPRDDLFISYGIALDLADHQGFIHRRPYQTVSLQRLATDLLGLEPREERPRITVRDRGTAAKGRYVCIATQSTSQAKYWTREGWERIIDHLHGLDYEVLCIDRHAWYGADAYMNQIPSNCLARVGDFDLHDRITDLVTCEFFIGLSSGLSWLAWALGKPVVLISGFTDPKNEFSTPYRVIERSVCHGCWNDPQITYDRNQWAWCPRHAGTDRVFECSRAISFEHVRDVVDACIRDLHGGVPGVQKASPGPHPPWQDGSPKAGLEGS
jgi:autotransporter strand-loop-strand O-heptosyltransferase